MFSIVLLATGTIFMLGMSVMTLTAISSALCPTERQRKTDLYEGEDGQAFFQIVYGRDSW